MQRAYGTWPSPITAGLIADGTIGLSQLVVDGADVYWIEQRPAEGGRHAIVRRDANGNVADALPATYSARTRVHEYGGGAYTVADGNVYFTHDDDQRLYRCAPGAMPVPLTPAGPWRYADLTIDRTHRRLLAVCEDHAATPPTNTLVAIDLTGARPPQTLVVGADFYAAPRVSADGKRLAWLNWNHPDMPWDAAVLFVAQCAADGRALAPRRIAGGDGSSVFQPTFAADGTLYFVDDRSGWWNLYRRTDDGVRPLLPRAAEFGVPQWVFGLSTYAVQASGHVVAAYQSAGRWQLLRLDLTTGATQSVDTPYTDISYVQAQGEQVLFIGATPTQPPAVVRLAPTGQRQVLRTSAGVCLEPGYLARAEALTFATADGDVAHAFYYRPRNHDIDSPSDERPPLLVMTHGGPTAATSAALNLKIQYWTSRGFAVLDVNYRGSTGFGRPYRTRLYGAWGVADVDDCVHGVQALVQRGDVDPARLAIRGSSAGGFTTLCALTFHSTFAAGASLYGVSDLEALAHDTHKFEARYLDRLIGPYPAARDDYRRRSPLHAADRLRRPVIFFQGLKDQVVPPAQTEQMVQALRGNGVPVAYLAFADEAHGFRQAATIERALAAELYFYGRVFGFTPADRLAPIAIDNLPPPAG